MAGGGWLCLLLEFASEPLWDRTSPLKCELNTTVNLRVAVCVHVYIKQGGRGVFPACSTGYGSGPNTLRASSGLGVRRRMTANGISPEPSPGRGVYVGKLL